MKINGKVLSGPEEVLIILPRQGDDIILKARAVLDFTGFEKICPRPKPPKVMRPGGPYVENVESPKYKEELLEWFSRRSEYMILKSLTDANPTLEFETIDIADPSTWGNIEKEFANSGFSEGEIMRISSAVLQANGLDDSKVEEAKERFLAQQVQDQDTNIGQKEEPSSTVVGGLAKDSVSNHQE